MSLANGSARRYADALDAREALLNDAARRMFPSAR